MQPHELRRLVADNIRRRAEKRRVSLNALADLAGIARSPFYRALHGQASLTLDRLCKIASALECNPRELLDDAGQGSSGIGDPAASTIDTAPKG